MMELLKNELVTQIEQKMRDEKFIKDNENLSDIYGNQEEFLLERDMSMDQVVTYAKNIFDRKNPDGIYKFELTDEYNDTACPFCCVLGNTKYIAKDNIKCLINSENGETCDINALEKHLLLEHSYFPETRFMTLLNTLDLDRIKQ